MLFYRAAAATSILYAGARWVYRRRSRRLVYWLAMPTEQPSDEWTGAPLEQEDLLERSVMNYRVACVSLALAFAGVFYAPFNFIGLPLTLFSAAPMIERALDASFREGRVTNDTLGTVTLYLTVAFNNYFLTSLLHWFYVLNERLAIELAIRVETMSQSSEMPTVDEILMVLQQALLRYEMWRNGDVIQLDSSQVRTVSPDTQPASG